jgi:Caspase domain
MKRLIILALATTMSAAACAQSWKNYYEAGLDAAKAAKWSDARADFIQASQLKHGDQPKGISFGGSLFGNHGWHGGAPYSPDFLAAYCGLKESLEMTGDARQGMLTQAAAEFEIILANRQYTAETFFFLDETYVLLGENHKRAELGAQYNSIGGLNWKVDTSAVADDDEALVSQLPAPAKQFLAPAPTKQIQPKQKSHATPEVQAATVASADPDVKPVSAKTTSHTPTPKIPAAPIVSTDPSVKPAFAVTVKPSPTPSEKAVVLPSIPTKAATPIVIISTAVKAPSAPTPTPVASTSAPAPALAPTPAAVSATAAQAPATTVNIVANQAPASNTATPSPAAQATSGTSQAPATTGPTPAPADPTPSKKQKKHRKDHDKSADTTATAPTATTGLVVPVSPKAIANGKAAPSANSVLGAVPAMGDKYAIIIGNSESKTPDGALPFAADDAQAVRQSLITDGGYLDQNIEVVINATAAQIAATVNALSSRVPDKGTVFIYFTGFGTNIDGKDYLAGVDTDASSDSSSMISKDDLYRAFMLKGARIFAFYQANRPIVDGHYFGSEVPLVGSISQMQATLPGESIYSINANGKQVGLFTNGFVSAMKDIRSNRTPILDFGWAVFYKLRRGDTGTSGGSSNQSPSLPVPINMASDARF